MYSEQFIKYLYCYQLEEKEAPKEITIKKAKMPILNVLKSAYATVPIINEKQTRL